jgi:type VI secretion system secreted protein Hcp
MASDFHIKFDGVDGEATHDKHPTEIEVLAWNWNVSNPANTSGGGAGSGKATIGEFVFTHTYSKASPTLAKHCSSGKHFEKAKFTARKAGGDEQKEFLTIEMKEVFITSISSSGSGGGDLIEKISCVCKDIEFSYKPQDAKGNSGGAIKFGLNIAAMKIR